MEEGGSAMASFDRVTGSGRRPLRVLASAFACAPNWGSEVGMGWRWAIHLARYCQLTVICESQFREANEAASQRIPKEERPSFHYLDIGASARRRFWKQGDFLFYKDYRGWQREAYALARRLTAEQGFDLAHQLNMIGYREPGYLWRLPLPFVWGPIGGHVQLPWRYLGMLGGRGAAFHATRNILNAVQMRGAWRVRKAAARARGLIAATEEDRRALLRIHGRDAIVISETGTGECLGRSSRPTFDGRRRLELVWSGIFQSGKALPIALRALARIPRERRPVLNIIGDGIEGEAWRSLANELGVSDSCQWHGRVAHERALGIMQGCDALVFTSLLEATSTVVLEALEAGLPVICHDCCGFGAVIDGSCGIKVPPRRPGDSVAGFAAGILQLIESPALVGKLSDGAVRRSCELTWDGKARTAIALYHEALQPSERQEVGERSPR